MVSRPSDCFTLLISWRSWLTRRTALTRYRKGHTPPRGRGVEPRARDINAILSYLTKTDLTPQIPPRPTVRKKAFEIVPRCHKHGCLRRPALALAMGRVSQLSGKGFGPERIIFISRKNYLRFTCQPKSQVNLPSGRNM